MNKYEQIMLLMELLALSAASEDVHLVVPPLQGRSQLGDVRRHAADADGVQGLPGEHGDAHGVGVKGSGRQRRRVVVRALTKPQKTTTQS